ncbi:MAG: FecR domain-containing protein, partial [Candidatus Cloacimonetes bacterium]|nr:FecR domain-containing protein [Candidatus Cloacimonadota bacterium]
MNKKIIVFISILFTISLLSGIDSVAKTIKIKGDIELTRNQNIYNVSTGDQLFNDDELVCKENSYAAIKFSDDSSIVKLFPNSLLIIHSEKKGEKFEKRNFLKMGEVWTKVKKRSGLFEIETPTTVASVKGTGFLLSVDENGVTDLYTLEGEVEFSNKFDDQTASITAGNRGTSSGEGIINVQPFDISDLPANIREFIEEEIVEPSEPQGSQVVPPTPHSADIPEMEPEADEADNGDSPLSMGGGIGTVSDGENFYTQVRLMPELRFGKFGLGLDIELMIDQEGKVRKEDWDEWEDYVNKLYYLRYGNRGDKLYGQIGAIPSYTLGQGLIMKNYSNMLHYPNEKQIGLQLGGQIPIAEMQAEIFTSNITKNEILAGRLSLAPLSTSGIPFIEKMRFGATVAHDTNQINGLSDLDDDNYPDAFDDYPEDSNWHNEVDANIDYYID